MSENIPEKSMKSELDQNNLGESSAGGVDAAVDVDVAQGIDKKDKGAAEEVEVEEDINEQDMTVVSDNSTNNGPSPIPSNIDVKPCKFFF